MQLLYLGFQLGCLPYTPGGAKAITGSVAGALKRLQKAVA